MLPGNFCFRVRWSRRQGCCRGPATLPRAGGISGASTPWGPGDLPRVFPSQLGERKDGMFLARSLGSFPGALTRGCLRTSRTQRGVFGSHQVRRGRASSSGSFSASRSPSAQTLLFSHTEGAGTRGLGRERRRREPASPGHRPQLCHCKNSQYTEAVSGGKGGLPELSPRYSGSIIMGRNSNYFACLSGNCNIRCLLNDSSSGDYLHIKPRSVCCHFKKN